ncbi:MAG: cyclic nucleotide-binding domain-containing protein [Cyanobacteria bacterium P01_H01_bin.26]
MKEIIQSIDHFSQLSEDQLRYLINVSLIQHYQPNQPILSSELSPQFYSFLLRGQWWMQRQIVGTTSPREWVDDRPGNWHGGIALIDKIAPPTVKAMTTCQVLHVPHDVLERLASENMHLAITMLRGVSGGSTMLYEHALSLLL